MKVFKKWIIYLKTFHEIKVFDIRPPENTVKNIIFSRLDFMAEIPEEMKESCDSLSCLHAIELYLSKPIGEPQQVKFHAHRIFSLRYLLKQFDEKYSIKQFSFVNDEGYLFENVNLTEEKINTCFNCKYGCGIFELEKN